MNETLQIIARRRSVRRFAPEQIDPAALQSIIDDGLQAPSGHNDQSCFLAVIQNRAVIQELSDGSKREMLKLPIDWMVQAGQNEKFHIYYNAPTVIIVAGRTDAITPEADVSAAIENMLLAAASLGIGACWIGFTPYHFSSQDKCRQIGIPDGYKVHYGVSLGYMAEGYVPKPPVKKYERYYTIIPE
jgi:nitroreductase